jgi:hypothetical protein
MRYSKVLDGLAQSLCLLICLVRISARQDNREFLATIARHQSTRMPQRVGKRGTYAAEAVVSDLVAVKVIELLKMIDVRQQQ